jgi:CubicO group peptidase (beta-lactamase class C family)
MSTRRAIVLTGAGLCADRVLGAQTGARPAGADAAASSPDPSTGLREAALADALKAGEALPGLRAVVVARQGRLVAERYYGGATAEMLQPVNSATKSVCSMLVGLALRGAKAPSGLDLQQTVAELLPEALAEVPPSPVGPVTLRQLMSGRSGLAFDWTRFNELAQTRSLARFVLRLPAVPVAAPGWSYNDALVSLLAPILARAQGADRATLADRQLFGPMGIEESAWRRDRDGQPMAAGGLALRTRDLLKLANLMLDGGRWQGVQVLPEAWVAESLRPHGPATWRAGPVEDIGYGLLWFTGRLHGQRVAWAWGYGGQFALLAPALGMAVATAATSPPPSALRAQTDGVMSLVGRVLQAAM